MDRQEQQKTTQKRMFSFRVISLFLGDCGTVRAVNHFQAIKEALKDFPFRRRGFLFETWAGNGWTYEVRRTDHKTAKYFSEQ